MRSCSSTLKRSAPEAQAVDEGHILDAETILRTYIDWFGRDNVYVELQQNLVTQGQKDFSKNYKAALQSTGETKIFIFNLNFTMAFMLLLFQMKVGIQVS